ncbi:MAG: RNA methyltransferase, partial [Acidobacteria bacterium]
MADQRGIDKRNKPSSSLSSPSETTVIFGRNAVLEALRAGSRRIHKLMIAKGVRPSHVQELVSVAKAQGVPVQWVEKRALVRIVGAARHQGIVAIVAPRPYAEKEDVLARLRPDSLFVLLDQVEDPQNLGAIIRTAHCAGVDAVVITRHRSAGLTHTVAKASAGAVEYTPVVRVTNLPSFIERLKG